MTRVRATLEGLAAIGVRDVAVVDGIHAEPLRDRLQLHTLPALNVRVLANLSWKNLSGSAILAARQWIEDSQRCLVVRGDRPLDAETLRLLVQCESTSIVVANAAVARGSEAFVKLATLADSDMQTVEAIGEDLANYDGVFTGHALVDRSILSALARLPNPTLEHALLELAQDAQVVALTTAWQWHTHEPVAIEEKVTALLEAKSHARYMLLNPGPVNTTATVKSALVHYDVCHRDPTFSELMVSLTNKLRRIYRGTPHHTVVALTGSGTAAMESALVSTVPTGPGAKKLLIIDNGAFGARLAEVATVHEMDFIHLRYDWGQQVNVEDVEHALAVYPDIAVVAMIHHETSVGLLNPVREIGALCKKHDALLIVDAVSSLGAEDIDVVRDNIDICYGSANKCLHAVSGASFMCVSPRVWARIEKLKPRAYYLDLRRYRKYMDELAQTPFTPAVSVYFALDAACSEFLADGHEARFEMYKARNKRLRDGLSALGMPSYTGTGNESNCIVTCRLPEGVAFDALYDAVKERGIIVYGCKGVLADRYMQIANMGDLSIASIEHFLDVMGQEIARLRAARTTPIGTAKSIRESSPAVGGVVGRRASRSIK
ncbi:MAG TPA: aminotransferase class V-fold PLP-dependent enzyme [Kofleriaceae bacterium]|nr:aminotransferase class V-fold PLP-dependent enzyme [Kofleriaceae bacterium]